MPEALYIELLDMAEAWASRARVTLREREQITPLNFAAGRRPEDRAALACAVELFDLIARQPGAQALLRELKLPGRPDSFRPHD